MELFLFMKCMWFIVKCLICFYAIYGLSYFVPLERILGIKNPPKKEGKLLSAVKQ